MSAFTKERKSLADSSLSKWVAPRQHTPYIPMSPYTKARVKRTRVVQLLFRLVELIGALAILFCVICINHTGVALGWIIRVAVSLHLYCILRKALTRWI